MIARSDPQITQISQIVEIDFFHRTIHPETLTPSEPGFAESENSAIPEALGGSVFNLRYDVPVSLQRQFPSASFANARATIVTSRRMVHVCRPNPNFVSILTDSRHLLEVDFLDTISVSVIIRM